MRTCDQGCYLLASGLGAVISRIKCRSSPELLGYFLIKMVSMALEKSLKQNHGEPSPVRDVCILQPQELACVVSLNSEVAKGIRLSVQKAPVVSDWQIQQQSGELWKLSRGGGGWRIHICTQFHVKFSHIS